MKFKLVKSSIEVRGFGEYWFRIGNKSIEYLIYSGDISFLKTKVNITNTMLKLLKSPVGLKTACLRAIKEKIHM